uniref:Focal_AT domain-containing protein n=1 Tax=Elaeophora elaphi TaxID=1147741 RepID=A0A0R3RFF0_9BILA
MSTESLYAAVNEVLKKLVAEAIVTEKCVKIVRRTTNKKIAPDKMEEIVTAAKGELQESVLNGVSQVIHNDEVLEGMIKLKNLIEASQEGITGWRPSGIPSDDITGHLQPIMFNIEEDLTKKRNFYKETENKVQAIMQGAALSSHIVSLYCKSV